MKKIVLAVSVMVGLAILSTSAEAATGVCGKYYKKRYLTREVHKAFATYQGRKPSPYVACGYAYGFETKKAAISEALRYCRKNVAKGQRPKNCKIYAAK